MSDHAERSQPALWADRRYPDGPRDTAAVLSRNAGRREGYVAGYAAGLGVLREGVEDFIAHMDGVDRGRIAGREVAQHLRRVLTEAENVEVDRG